MIQRTRLLFAYTVGSGPLPADGQVRAGSDEGTAPLCSLTGAFGLRGCHSYAWGHSRRNGCVAELRHARSECAGEPNQSFHNDAAGWEPNKLTPRWCPAQRRLPTFTKCHRSRARNKFSLTAGSNSLYPLAMQRIRGAGPQVRSVAVAGQERRGTRINSDRQGKGLTPLVWFASFPSALPPGLYVCK